jgi:hypothetical protein
MKQINPLIELASGEFDRRAGVVAGKPSIDAVAAVCGVNPASLRHYRANYISRKRRPDHENNICTSASISKILSKS